MTRVNRKREKYPVETHCETTAEWKRAIYCKEFEIRGNQFPHYVNEKVVEEK